MRYKKLSMDEAHLFVRSKRDQIDPNFAFLGQLLDYERKLSGKTAETTAEEIENKTFETTEFRQAERRKIIAPKVGTLRDLNLLKKRKRPPPGSLVIGDTRKRRSKNSDDSPAGSVAFSIQFFFGKNLFFFAT